MNNDKQEIECFLSKATNKEEKVTNCVALFNTHTPAGCSKLRVKKMVDVMTSHLDLYFIILY